MSEAVVHLFVHVSVVFLELSDRVGFNALDLVLLALELPVELVGQSFLLVSSSVLFLGD